MSRRFEITGVTTGAALFGVAFSPPLLKQIDLVYNIFDWDRARDLDWRH